MLDEREHKHNVEFLRWYIVVISRFTVFLLQVFFSTLLFVCVVLRVVNTIQNVCIQVIIYETFACALIIATTTAHSLQSQKL